MGTSPDWPLYGAAANTGGHMPSLSHAILIAERSRSLIDRIRKLRLD
jgi:hypothetical protein